MSDIDQEDRTEQPTDKRLKDAREKGQIPRSKELANVAVMGASAVAVIAMAPMMGAGARSWFRQALTIDPAMIDAPERLFWHFSVLLGRLMLVVSPVILVALLACFVSPLVMGGLRFSTEALAPKFSRLNPAAGLKRMYGREAMAEFVKSLLRVAIVGGVGGAILTGAFATFVKLPHQDLVTAAAAGTGVVGKAIVFIVGAMGLLALLDVPWQHLSHIRQLRMTKQEIRDEFKEQEGNPELKARVRQVQRQLANQRMMEAVPTADVVIVNPTHYSVALKYDAETMSAPRVVAKGVDEIALNIREIAKANNVTVVEAPPLARVLHRQAKVGQDVPVQLYTAVAQVLAYVFQLRAWTPGRSPMPRLTPVHVDEPQDP